MKKTNDGIRIGQTILQGSNFAINNVAKFFGIGRGHDDSLANQRVLNSQALSQEDMEYGSSLLKSQGFDQVSTEGGIDTIHIQFDQYFMNKSGRISQYRSMALYPEIADAIRKHVNSSIVPDYKGKYCYLELTRQVPEHIEEQLHKAWEYWINDVFQIRKNGYNYFRSLLVDGEVYLELIINEKGNNLIGVKQLPPFTMYPIYRGEQAIAYVQSMTQYAITQSSINIQAAKDDVLYDREQIAYVHNDHCVANKWDVRGFLEGAIRVYNQLKQLEDANVIAKIVRAPVRRLWNIGTNNMTKSKAEEYVRSLMQRYRKRVKYDPSTGAMDAAENFQAITEDIWMPRPEGTQGTTITNIDGGTSFDDMSCVDYYLNKLYKVLVLPSNRWTAKKGDSGSAYHSGRSNEIMQEEVDYSRFISNQQELFKPLLLDPFITLLKLRGFDDRYVDHSLFNIRFNEANEFKKFKNLEITETRLNVLAQATQFTYSAENPEGFLSLEFVMRNMFQMSDEEYEENFHLLQKEKENVIESQSADEDNVTGPEVANAAKDTSNTETSGFGQAEENNEEETTQEEVPNPNTGKGMATMGGTEQSGGVESYSLKNFKTKNPILLEFFKG